ncbi:oligosaccharide flippase family protein [Pseudomonas shirazensis]
MSKVFFGRIVRVLLGTFGAQLITIGVMLLLVRLYTPGEIGGFSVWVSAATIISVLLTGRYELALFSTGQSSELSAVIKLVIFLVLGLSVAVTGLLLVTPYATSRLPVEISHYWFALTVVAAGLAINKLLLCVLTYQQAFNRLGLARISLAACIAVSQVAAAYLLEGEQGLVYGQTFGVLLATGLAVLWVGKSLLVRSLSATLEEVAEVARSYSNFPKYSLPADLINTVSSQLPVILLASKFGGEIAGWFALTLRMMGAPISLLAASVLDVFKEQAAREYRDLGSCRKLFLSTFKVLALLALPPFIIIGFFAESAFALIFGAEWMESGRYAVLLIPLFYMRFVVSPLSYTIYIAQRQNLDLLWQFTLLAMTVACFMLPGSIESVLTFYAAGYAFMYFIYFWISFHCAKGEAN